MEKMLRPRRFSLHVAVVALAIAYIYFSTVLVFISRCFGLRSSPGILHTVFFTFLAVMCVYSYRLALYTDPGRVPHSYHPDVEDSSSPIHEVKRKGGDFRYCQKCSHYKPPRSHHCRICNRCVLRMDHHCVWMDNCIGHANYKFFFVFVVYAVIACIYSLSMLISSVTVDTRKDVDKYRRIHVISGLLLVPLSLALALFLCWHIYLILRNKTTIEYHEGVTAMVLAKNGGQLYSHPYDIGAYENLIAILGQNVIYWLWPTSTHLGSGISFRTKFDEQMGISLTTH